MRKVITLVIFLAMLGLARTSADASPVTLISSEFHTWGSWISGAKCIEGCDPNGATNWGSSGIVDVSATNVGSLAVDIETQHPPDATRPAGFPSDMILGYSESHTTIENFSIEHIAEAWGYTEGGGGGTTWQNYDKVDTFADASWSFTPTGSLLTIDLDYEITNINYPEDIRAFNAMLIDLTTTDTLLSLDWLYGLGNNFQFQFSVNPYHDYELSFYLETSSYDWTEIDSRFAARIDTVPEPSTLLLLGVGLLGVSLLRRRLAK